MKMLSIRFHAASAALISLLTTQAYAHDHSQVLSEEDLTKPIDFLLWTHIFIQSFVWLLLFPTGMVLGIVRQRFHVPLQLLGYLLTAGGYILGHTHGGRRFGSSAHEKFATFMLFPILIQFCLGIYLKLHIHEGSLGRRLAVTCHSLVGSVYPLLGWVQLLLGYIVVGDYCHENAADQCITHYLLGSSLVAYGIIMAIISTAARDGMATSKSSEWLESWFIMILGIIITSMQLGSFIATRRLSQHISLGILWWTGGSLGVWTSQSGQRSIVPAVVVVLTGWATSAFSHSQSTFANIQAISGASILLAGLARGAEICFLVARSDKNAVLTLPLQHLAPYLLIAAGLLFITSTDEQLWTAEEVTMDHVAFSLLIFSIAFLCYLFVTVLLYLYGHTGRNSVSHQREVSGSDRFALEEPGTYDILTNSQEPYESSPTLHVGYTEAAELKS